MRKMSPQRSFDKEVSAQIEEVESRYCRPRNKIHAKASEGGEAILEFLLFEHTWNFLLWPTKLQIHGRRKDLSKGTSSCKIIICQPRVRKKNLHWKVNKKIPNFEIQQSFAPHEPLFRRPCVDIVPGELMMTNEKRVYCFSGWAAR